MKLHLPINDPGWPGIETEESFQALSSVFLIAAQNRAAAARAAELEAAGETPPTSTTLPPQEAGEVIEFNQPAVASVEATTAINTATFTAAHARNIICLEPPFEMPPEPHYDDPPEGWNQPVIIPDPIVEIVEPVVEPDPIPVELIAGNKSVCVNALKLPDPLATQTTNPDVGGEFTTAPSIGVNDDGKSWNSGDVEVGDTFPIIPGDWTPPLDGNTYDPITKTNGTLTVVYCDPVYDVICDAKVCAIGRGNLSNTDVIEDGYEVSDQTGYFYISNSGGSENRIKIALVVAIRFELKTEEAPEIISKAFNVSFTNESSRNETVITVGISQFDSTVYTKLENPISLTEEEVSNLANGNISASAFLKTGSFKITIEEVNDDFTNSDHLNYRYKRSFELNPKIKFCIRCGSPGDAGCNNSWKRNPYQTPDQLWSGTATIYPES